MQVQAKVAAIFQDYIAALNKELKTGQATEPSYYPALKQLLESLAPGGTATNEPKRTQCGAPDFRVTREALTLGYVEAKDLGTGLDQAEASEQLQRYRKSLSNLVLTNFLEFRWYVKGERRLLSSVGSLSTQDRVKGDGAGKEAVADLLGRFLSYEAEGVGTALELAQWMARLAHRLRDLIVEAFNKKQAPDILRDLHKTFCDTLVPDLPEGQFADMFAQTVAYGLFAARYHASEGSSFTRQGARELVPKTNPFLRNIFDYMVGAQLPEILAPEVEDLVQLLRRADMTAIMQDFARRQGREDPVVHFYETFLATYNPAERERRGVYYTPLPVVSYIVRSIDHLLRTRFARPMGLADPAILILDPACGTATFLYEVVDLVYLAMTAQGQRGMWDGYVAKDLLPRLFGFELMMAPYAIAHLKLERQLLDTGYQFGGHQRLEIYLTNTLEEALKKSELLFGQFIVQEANAAAEIKKEKPIMVVLGNPPYSGISANRSYVERRVEKGKEYLIRVIGDPRRWVQRTAKRDMKKVKEPTFIGKLLLDYYGVNGNPLEEKNPKWLQDDYVKFIRFGQWRIERTGRGILSFITNHAYLDNPTFRGMRQSLMNTFSEIYLLDLHGNARKKEVAHDGSPDENVFDIQQGVAIGIFVKEPGKSGPAKVYHADLWGVREDKYRYLSETDVALTSWAELHLTSPFYFFVPREEWLLPEYEQGWKVTDIFPVNSVGIVTARDHLTIRWLPEDMRDTVRDFSALAPEQAREKYKLGEDVRDWKVELAQKDLKDTGLRPDLVVPVLYRPFDIRYTYYTGHSRGFICMPRPEVMRHMLAGKNMGLVFQRGCSSSDTMNLPQVSTHPIDQGASYPANRALSYLAPLYVYPAKGEMKLQGKVRPNLSQELIQAFSQKLGLQFVEDGRGDLEKTFGPEDIFHYIYAVLHCPTYRSHYAGFLKVDFPRLPLTSDRKLFAALVAKGGELVSLHLMESPLLNNPNIKYPVPGSHGVEKVAYHEPQGRVYINKTQYFEGIEPKEWDFQIGGYQVAEKWLKDRKGRTLSYEERTHYQKVVVAIGQTIRLMDEIDALIPGFPLL